MKFRMERSKDGMNRDKNNFREDELKQVFHSSRSI